MSRIPPDVSDGVDAFLCETLALWCFVGMNVIGYKGQFTSATKYYKSAITIFT